MLKCAAAKRSHRQGGHDGVPLLSSCLLFAFTTWAVMMMMIPFAHAQSTTTCSHGRIFISDLNNPDVHIYEWALGGNNSQGQHQVQVEALLGLEGEAGQYLQVTRDGLYVFSTFRGSLEIGSQDGVVNVIATSNTNTSTTPYLVPVALLECGPMRYATGHADLHAFFCDGGQESRVNSSYSIFNDLDRSNPFMYTNLMLNGSHRGVAIPVDNELVLHSLQNRTDWTPENSTYDTYDWITVDANSLANAFQVVNLSTTNAVVEVVQTFSPCNNFTGSAVSNDSFYFCCARSVLVIDFDAATKNFTKRVLRMRGAATGRRCTSIQTNDQSSVLVADFVPTETFNNNGGTLTNQLLAVPKDATAVSPNDVLNVGDIGVCAYGIDRSDGNYVVVLLRDGTVHVYTYSPSNDGNNGWTLVVNAPQAVQSDSSDLCSDVKLAMGYQQAFVAVGTKQIVFSFDLEDIPVTSKIRITVLYLDYVPFDIVVGGIPEANACRNTAVENI